MEQSCEFTMFGQTWRCVRKPNNGSADCRMKSRIITVDSRMDEEDFLDYLHHELTEAAVYYVGCTYSKEFPDDDELYIMNHTQMDNASSAIRGAYDAIKKAMLPLQPLVNEKGPDKSGPHQVRNARIKR